MNNKLEILSSELMSIIESIRPPAQTIPHLFLLCEVLHRSGISGSLLFAKTVARLGMIDIPTDTNPDGTYNKIIAFLKIVTEEIVNSIKDDAVTVNTIAASNLSFTTSGGNAGGGAVINVINNANTQYKGVVQ